PTSSYLHPWTATTSSWISSSASITSSSPLGRRILALPGLGPTRSSPMETTRSRWSAWTSTTYSSTSVSCSSSQQCWECSAPRRKRSPSSPAQRIEVAQIGRCLVLLGRHQIAVHAAQVGLLAEKHIAVVLGADVLDPGRVADASVAPGHRPGSGQGVIERGDLVAQHVVVGLVEEQPLLDHRLIVLVQRNSARVEDARPLERAGLDFEHAMAAAVIRIGPTSDRVARERRLDRRQPVPPVAVD